jgi:DNA modification methylase
MKRPKMSASYLVQSVADAKEITWKWAKRNGVYKAIKLGLPEVDDRYDVWRVPVLSAISHRRIGEVVIDAKTTLIDDKKTTTPVVLKNRILAGSSASVVGNGTVSPERYQLSGQRNTIALGDAEDTLLDMAANSVDLVFTSPPYYNARPEYSDYITYEDYLLKMRKVIQSCHRVLNEGRFFAINVAPVLIRRASRSEASTRIAVPFDIHHILIDEGFDFIDDIIWVKPEGAGWATGRGRRFAADRNPLQYKAVPVNEYVLVYRKHSERLIDWNIRTYPNQKAVRESRISGEYERTNVWAIKPTHSKSHPAVFPDELAERVIRYYSFIGDVVLDPFAGIGTVGRVATRLGRRFVLVEVNKKYVEVMVREARKWLGKESEKVMYLGCSAPNDSVNTLF